LLDVCLGHRSFEPLTSRHPLLDVYYHLHSYSTQHRGNKATIILTKNVNAFTKAIAFIIE
jgi:hypothetical protein